MRKLIGTFLSVLLVVALLAGCGSNAPKTDSKQPGSYWISKA